jgi:hypothetical protein
MLVHVQRAQLTIRLLFMVPRATDLALGATASLGAHNHALSCEVGSPSEDRATNDSRKIG